MADLADAVDEEAARTGFSGVVRVDVGASTVLEQAYGLAERNHHVANTVQGRFALASGAKGLTALTVVSLVESGELDLTTPARSLLGRDLPLVADDVTVEHLLAHRAGIGDYVDEESGLDVNDYVLPVPVHELTSTEDYLRVLDGHPAKFAAGERFAYCNSGYVLLALLAERATDETFAELVEQRVCTPAGMVDTAFLRTDELSERVATGYLHADGRRTNQLHLPVLGSGDGGVYSTVEDVHRLWAGFLGGRVVSPRWVEEMLRPRSEASPKLRYGLGFWLPRPDGTAMLEGCDAGVSFRSVCTAGGRLICTVISNTSDGAWPVVRRLEGLLPSLGDRG